MIVTDLNYNIDNRLLKKINLMIGLVTADKPKRDALLIVEGAEGLGKTNLACAIAYYVKDQTKRDVHLFFRLQPLIELAQSTEEKIIIWDEPALDALSTDWYKKTNKDIIRLLMVVRKKRHFMIFNFTKFHKFSDYIIVDRSLGMVHVYARKEIKLGRFVYVPKKNLEYLYRKFRTSKIRMYKKFSTSRGSFPEVLEKYFDKMDFIVEGKPHSKLIDYDKLKDDSIMSVGKIDKDEKEQMRIENTKAVNELRKLKGKLSKLNYPIEERRDFVFQLGIHIKTLDTWRNYQKLL